MSIAQPRAVVLAHETDRELMDLVLRPYREHCKYLKGAVLEVDDDHRLTASGPFEIGESCYIDDTGHFNAVEFNICYNQLAYYLIAKSVAEGLLPALGQWTLADFWRRQLPHILITEFRSKFIRQMQGKRLSGSVSVTKVLQLEKSDRWDQLTVLQTSCQFWDQTGGRSRGGATIAITNPV
jgi:hypothetical protein